MKEIRLDDKLNFVEEPVKIMDREVKQLKQSRIPIVKVRWNSKRGPEFTWEHEDQIHAKKILPIEIISLMYNLVRVSILSVALVGMKYADLVRRSTMTQIVSCPFDDLDLDGIHHSKQQNCRSLLVMLRLELHKASILAVGKPTLDLLPRYTSGSIQSKILQFLRNP
uniref:Putative reverse transcriptase domain-containing protein n=1 Tax=Tanacetum cinerariifolium TaxID=118510 RepID=A0A699IB45_TANCI|nr:putative reverse transcriptase domain-containing protein [Tanacetum cinerariifolium]